MTSPGTASTSTARRSGRRRRTSVQRWRDRDSLPYTVQGLTCGTGYTVGVDAFDRERRPLGVDLDDGLDVGVPGTAAPSAPAGCARSRRRRVGDAGVDALLGQRRRRRVRALRLGAARRHRQRSSATLTGLACGKSYLSRSTRPTLRATAPAQSSAYFKTSACPSTNKPPTTPTVVKVTAATDTTVVLCLDRLHRRRRRDRLRALPVRLANQRDNRHDRAVHRAQVRHDVHARSRRQGRRRPALGACEPLHRDLTLRTPAAELDGLDHADDRERCDVEGCRELVCGLRRQRRQGRGRPGKRRVRRRRQPRPHRGRVPFGDDAGFWPSTRLRTARHTFEVRAVNGSGTVLAKNTVTATVANTTTAADELDGLDHPDDRERCDVEGCRELARGLRRATATRSRTTREGRVASSTATSCAPRSSPVR